MDTASKQDEAVVAGISSPHESASLHVSGEATYVDDIPEMAGTRYIALGLSQRAHARIRGLRHQREAR